MKNISVLNNNYLTGDNFKTNYYGKKLSFDKPVYSPDNFSLTAEGGIMFFYYLKSFNLAKEPDLMILSPNHHYYYDENDFKSIRTLLNLKKLNLIKDIETFLQSLHSILPTDVNFIGCFSDYKTVKGNGLMSRLSTTVINLLDSKIDHDLDKKSVSELLEKYSFQVVDMTELNDLVYFYSRHIVLP